MDIACRSLPAYSRALPRSPLLRFLETCPGEGRVAGEAELSAQAHHAISNQNPGCSRRLVLGHCLHCLVRREADRRPRETAAFIQESPREREESVPAVARAQPGRLVSVG